MLQGHSKLDNWCEGETIKQLIQMKLIVHNNYVNISPLSTLPTKYPASTAIISSRNLDRKYIEGTKIALCKDIFQYGMEMLCNVQYGILMHELGHNLNYWLLAHNWCTRDATKCCALN